MAWLHDYTIANGSKLVWFWTNRSQGRADAPTPVDPKLAQFQASWGQRGVGVPTRIDQYMALHLPASCWDQPACRPPPMLHGPQVGNHWPRLITVLGQRIIIPRKILKAYQHNPLSEKQHLSPGGSGHSWVLVGGTGHYQRPGNEQLFGLPLPPRERCRLECMPQTPTLGRSFWKLSFHCHPSQILQKDVLICCVMFGRVSNPQGPVAYRWRVCRCQ